MHADRQTDEHDEGNRRYLLFMRTHINKGDSVNMHL
jgi:hypothetical protein